ncbi:hypothetical protein K737_300841 [Holospora undulata HU1]|uniref:Uncharacterized protein n=1 Tax=Holospora undulata HU1 TaxID=1321371 RepID=A0A061JIB3_9PROT|nr:hypothetical protein K737_300841 [Holospora undulata HU1]
MIRSSILIFHSLVLLKSDKNLLRYTNKETQIERQKNNKNKKIKNRKNKQKQFYSGKKKRLAIKIQVVVDKKIRQGICVRHFQRVIVMILEDLNDPK